MPLDVQGLREAEAAFRRLSGRPLQRIQSESMTDAIGLAYRYARRNNVGFVNRKGWLRASLRIEQSRDRLGRFATAVQLVAGTYYARWVEHKPRTIDQRPGPPYWFGFVGRRVRDRVIRRTGRLIARNVQREWVRK